MKWTGFTLIYGQQAFSKLYKHCCKLLTASVNHALLSKPTLLPSIYNIHLPLGGRKRFVL